jgi:hypothetical protein
MGWRRRWTRWFATGMVFFAAACSEATAEGPQSPGSEVPSPTEGTLTSADGEIMGDVDHPGYSVEVPAGWSTLDGHFFVKDGGGVLGMSVWDVSRVPRDPCHWKRTTSEVGPSVDDLVDALSSQLLRDATAPVDVTLAGHDGQYLELSVPDDRIVTGDADFKGCDDPGNGHNDFVSWYGTDRGERFQQVAGQVDRVWVLDVEGQTLLVDATYSPDISAADREELDQVVASIRFVDA